MIENRCELPTYSYNAAGIRRCRPPALDKRAVNHPLAGLWAAEYAAYAETIPSYDEVMDILQKSRHNTHYKLR